MIKFDYNMYKHYILSNNEEWVKNLEEQYDLHYELSLERYNDNYEDLYLRLDNLIEENNKFKGEENE